MQPVNFIRYMWKEQGLATITQYLNFNHDVFMRAYNPTFSLYVLTCESLYE